MKVIIISGGNIDEDFALDFLENERYDKIVAADRGMEFCRKNDIEIDEIIGDFDSVDQKVLSYYKTQNVRIHTLCPQKDDSDTQSALKLAKEAGAKEVVLLGGTGTRLDHVWANVQLVAACRQEGIKLQIYDAHNYISVWTEGFTLERKKQFGTYVSFFSLGDHVNNLTLNGFKYALNGYYLKNTDSGLTVSNEIIEEKAQVTFDSGMLLMIQSRDS